MPCGAHTPHASIPTIIQLDRRLIVRSNSCFISRQAFIAGLAAIAACPLPAFAANAHAPMSADEALKTLMDGNDIFVGTMARKSQTITERAALGAGQSPFASILTCADSRTTPEIIFNQGLGDIFVVRVAGNVATKTETASLEYGCGVLKTPLIIVMGHSSCGAVKAAIDAIKGQTFPGDIGELATLIRPAAEAVKSMPGDWATNATKENVRRVVSGLQQSPVLSDLSKSGALNIVGAYYSLETGTVSLVKAS
jgi:carbonic anhydrase